ncbi:SLC13 family permease [Photobacterium rosenbergii]|uniref:SLC13 family permease n=1 Tax=Photobacterium rosenbergii TaxID=294936 RepID=UPI001C9946CE|nr:SLC13 family permease [Photobacterium rosenbergii]MBY5947398.1 SLC13 family permease [Photobacterium rosenbergii]
MAVTAIVMLAMLLALVFSRFKACWVFAVAVAALYIGGEIERDTILANMVNPSVMTLLMLMMASLALERSAVLTWLAGKIFHTSYSVTLLRMGSVTALSSAFLNNTAVVATLMGSVMKNHDHAPSRLLIPLSYFAILGGTLTLIGTATNLVINGLLHSQGLATFSIFSFFPVGILLLLACGLVVLLMAQRLPSAASEQEAVDSYFLEAKVEVNSRLVGKTVRQNGLRAMDGLFLAEIIRDGQLISPVTPDIKIAAGDHLIFTGQVTEVSQISQISGLTLYADHHTLLQRNLTEVIISPESVLVNRTLKQTNFRSQFDAAVVAIRRKGQTLSGKLGEQMLWAGDQLVLATGEDFDKRQNLARNFFFLTGKQVKEPMAPWQNVVALVGFVAAIVLAAITSMSLMDTLAVFLFVAMVSGIIDSSTLRRRFPFELWTILASALSVAYAFSHSGLAASVSDQLFTLLGERSVYLAFAGVFVATVILTETMTNSAAAAIMLPVGVAFAQTYGVNIEPFAMAVAYAASASFVSPYGYQTNLMVMNAGQYSLRDYVQTGWPLTICYCVVALVAIPYFFAF